MQTVIHAPVVQAPTFVFRLERSLVNGFKVLYASIQASNMAQRGEEVTTEDLQRLGLID